jgi:hypothetical protein
MENQVDLVAREYADKITVMFNNLDPEVWTTVYEMMVAVYTAGCASTTEA